ncbi:MAG TPA: glycosyltransferase family 4 protein [Planctomycetota bacterium]
MLLVSEPLVPGGIAVYTSSLMSGLTEAGIPHPLVTSAPPTCGLLSEREDAQVQVVNGLFWSFWRPLVFRQLVKWAREHEVSLIHGLSALAAPVCARLARALNVPFIVTVHHFQKAGSLHFDKQCRGVIAVSEALRENLVNDADIPKEVIRCISAGIQVPQILQPRPGVDENNGHSIPLISSIGKLIPRKDYVTFLRAARLIVDQLGTECSFVIAGDGPEESRLRKLARQLKIDKQLTFCHGTASQGALLRDTDVYVQCSKVEGFGTMVLQAMARGVPVVATSTGGLLTLVKDGETGYLVPIGDSAALAARVLDMITNKELRQRLAENAREVALSSYNLEAMMSRTIAVYGEAVAQAAMAG